MKYLIQATLSIGLVLGSVNSADACCVWPFCGWWGAGYAAPAYGYAQGPNYGYYAASYPSWDAPVYGGSYAAGYAPAQGCCAPSCCNACGSGSCVSGSCAESTLSESGSLKPANDPNFKNGKQKDEYDDRNLEQDRVNPPADDELPAFERPSRAKTNAADPADVFDATPMDPNKTGTDSFKLDSDSNRINNKPPMPEATELPAVEPKDDGKTFLDTNDATEKQTQLERRKKTVAEQSSRLNEVIVPRRLATRSLPSSSAVKPVSWAGKANDDKSRSPRPVRWISVPRPDDQVRL